MRPLSAREEAEAIEQFGEELEALCSAFFKKWDRMSAATKDRLCTVDNVERYLSDWSAPFETLGAKMSAECDAAEEAEDRRRDNPLEPDFRRLGQ